MSKENRRLLPSLDSTTLRRTGATTSDCGRLTEKVCENPEYTSTPDGETTILKQPTEDACITTEVVNADVDAVGKKRIFVG
jgi:hypothetical protein